MRGRNSLSDDRTLVLYQEVNRTDRCYLNLHDRYGYCIHVENVEGDTVFYGRHPKYPF